jgi:hypothetical protein
MKHRIIIDVMELFDKVPLCPLMSTMENNTENAPVRG